MAADHPGTALTVTSEEEDQENIPFVENLSQAEAGEVLLCLGQASRKMRARVCTCEKRSILLCC